MRTVGGPGLTIGGVETGALVDMVTVLFGVPTVCAFIHRDWQISGTLGWSLRGALALLLDLKRLNDADGRNKGKKDRAETK